MTTESRLREVCEKYGPIEEIVMVKDLEGKSRGYAFVEYTYAEDMKAAYNHLNHYRLDERSLIVDVERGRTVRKWLPARLGGGKGNTRATRPKKVKARRSLNCYFGFIYREPERYSHYDRYDRRDRYRDDYRDRRRDSYRSRRY